MIINICKDIIVPKDEWSEEEWLKKVKGFGVEGILFWDGVSLDIDPLIVEPSFIYNGTRTFKLLGKEGEWFYFGYSWDGETYDLKFVKGGKEIILISIPIIDQFSALL